MTVRGFLPMVLALAASAAPVPGRAGTEPRLLDAGPHSAWMTFTTRDGLPSNKAFAVRVDGDRVWVGTSSGLALYDGGEWKRLGRADGLPHDVVLSIDVSPRSGDVWIGTMGGLARFSAGRLDSFTQLNSGLPNDFVHAVRCDPEEDVVWVATAMGAGRLDLRSKQWSIFTHRNTPMHEPWTYSIAMGDGAVYLGAWGAGVLEYTKAGGRWREYRDPDHEFEIDLFPDDGPVNDVTSGIDYGAGLLWQGTYTGLTLYDGREWRSFFADDSGLASDFINFVRARGERAWLATDRGLSVTDGAQWITYRRLDDGRGEVVTFEGGREAGRWVTPTALAHNYVLGVDVRGDEVWVATGDGVSRGTRDPSIGLRRLPAPAAERAAAPPRAKDAAEARRFRYAGTPEALLPYRRYTPYKEFFTERTPFRGPGRDEPEPADLDEVRIGFIGPLEAGDLPRDPGPLPRIPGGARRAAIGRRMLRGATLAVEEANARGGYRGIPFRIVPRTDLVLWGQTSNELVRFALEDRVWAVLSGFDSNHSHVLSRSALKAEVLVLSAGASDPTLVEHSIPWLARCIHDDRQNAYALLNEIFLVRGHSRVAVLRSNDRDGRVGVEEFIQGARRLGRPVAFELRFENDDVDFRDQLERMAAASPDAIVLWGDAYEAAHAVRQIREMGLNVALYGFDRMARPEFLEIAGAAAEGVVVTASMNPDRPDPLWRRFEERYRRRWGEPPDALAAHAFDGANLIIEAIRKAGLNRARIRDAIYELRSVRGVTGEIRFDTNMNDVGRPWLAEVRRGRFEYRRSPGWPASIEGMGAR
ncbi:MAG: ABC transporter substrate-binding protein [Acidobacteriota bacterium]